MSDENKGIVGGTAGLDPSKLFAATRQVFANAAVPQNQQRNTGVECPICKAEGVLQNPVMSEQAGLQCNMGHKYRDTDDLMSRPHGTVPVVLHKTIQPNQVNVTFAIPNGTLLALQSKYGADAEKMKATFASLAQVMVEPNTLIIGEVDLRRMGDVIGQPIRTPAELYGVIKGQQKQIEDLTEAAKQGANQGGSPAAGSTVLRRGELILWFDPPTTASLSEKAQSAGVRLEEFLEAFIKQGQENSWF